MELGDSGKKEKADGNTGAVLVCTDVAARGLDIPNVQNVLHYQCPFNAEIYVHRCGRTARIGKTGETLALLAPSDEKNFRLMCDVLGKPLDEVRLLDVSYSTLEIIRPVVNTAIELEKSEFKKQSDEKSASWLLKLAKDADLTLDENLQEEVRGKLAGSKRTRGDRDGEEDDIAEH